MLTIVLHAIWYCSLAFHQLDSISILMYKLWAKFTKYYMNYHGQWASVTMHSPVTWFYIQWSVRHHHLGWNEVVLERTTDTQYFPLMGELQADCVIGMMRSLLSIVAPDIVPLTTSRVASDFESCHYNQGVRKFCTLLRTKYGGWYREPFMNDV